MSAIAGFIGRNASAVPECLISEMLGSMFYDRAVTSPLLSFRDVGLKLGWLSSADPTNDMHSAWDAKKERLLLLRGEVFSQESGTCTSGDTSIAAHLLPRVSDAELNAFANLNGCFSGVLVDLRSRTVVLFNDRYGVGRLYYHETPEGVYFSSEAKALLRVLPSLRQLDLRSMGEFLACDCVLQDRTIFHNVFILPSGSSWVFESDGAVQKHRYFRPSQWEQQPRLSARDYYVSLKDALPKVIKRYVHHRDGVGMSLTGGLDGRLVMAWAQLEPGDLPCYTFGSSLAETADVALARQIASVCRQPHTEFKVNGDFLHRFPKLAHEAIQISDATMDVTGAAELYGNRLAREIRPVRLTGNYGSEILRGNIAFRPRPVFEGVFDSQLLDAIGEAHVTYAEESRGDSRSFIAFKQVPWYHYARSSLEKSQLIVRSPYLDNEIVALSFQSPESDETNFDVCLRVAAEGNFELARIPTDRGIRYGANRLRNHLRCSTAQFLAKAEYAYDYGMPTWLARLDRALSPLRVERMFLGRQKFCHFRTWYRRELSEFVREILLDCKTLARPFLKRQHLEGVVSSHITGRANHTLLIHKLLSLELVHRTLLEQN